MASSRLETLRASCTRLMASPIHRRPATFAGVDRSMMTDQSKVVNMNDCCPSVLAEPLAEGQAQDLATVFAALADPVRLRLLSLVADAGEICSCDLLAPLGKAQPTISHH